MTEKNVCGNCNSEIQDPRAAFCGTCGHPIQRVDRKHVPSNSCPNCGAEIRTENAAFCGSCGQKLNGEKSKPSVESVAHKPFDWMNSSSTKSTVSGAEQTPANYSQSPQAYNQGEDYLRGAPFLKPDVAKPVNKGALFTAPVLKVIAAYILVQTLAQIMRYLLTKDAFPTLDEILWTLLIYVIFIFTIFAIQIEHYRKKGIYPVLKVDKFNFSASLVLSSFFIILIPHEFKADNEYSTVGEEVKVWSDQNQTSLIVVPREGYVRDYIRLEVIKKRYYFTLVFGYILWYLNTQSQSIEVINMAIVAVGIYSFLHIAPGISNDRQIILGKKRFVGFLFLILSVGIIVLGFSLSIPSL